MAAIPAEVIEQMTGDLQRSLRLPAVEIVSSRTVNVICDAYKIYAIAIMPGALKSATNVLFSGSHTQYAADLTPSERYLLILRPYQSVDFRCKPAEGLNRGPAFVFILTVDVGFNEVLPVRRYTEQMFTIIATAGPPIRVRFLGHEMGQVGPIQRAVAPSDSSVILELQQNVEYEILVEAKDLNRDRRLFDPTTLIKLHAAPDLA